MSIVLTLPLCSKFHVRRTADHFGADDSEVQARSPNLYDRLT